MPRCRAQMLPVARLKWHEEIVRPRVERLVEQIAEQGVREPIHATPWRDGFAILDGHHRAMAARQLGLDVIPAHVLSVDPAKPIRGWSYAIAPLEWGYRLAALPSYDGPVVAQVRGGDATFTVNARSDSLADLAEAYAAVSAALRGAERHRVAGTFDPARPGYLRLTWMMPPWGRLLDVVDTGGPMPPGSTKIGSLVCSLPHHLEHQELARVSEAFAPVAHGCIYLTDTMISGEDPTGEPRSCPLTARSTTEGNPSMSTDTQRPSATAFVRHYALLEKTAAAIEQERPEPGPVPFRLPALTPQIADYLTADIVWRDGARLGDHPVAILDMMGDPRTRTTKASASQLMVLRAIQLTAETGQKVAIITPSSGNKASALRAAVLQAYEHGLATPDTLRIVVVVPEDSLGKLRAPMGEVRPEWVEANPTYLLSTREGQQHVKDMVADALPMVEGELDWVLMPSGDVDNYRLADCVRAYVEAEHTPAGAEADGGADGAGAQPVWHAHAISSGHGFFGLQLGVEQLEFNISPDLQAPAARPAYLVCQQPGCSDMVLHSLTGSFDESGRPAYEIDETTGDYVQSDNPHFPQVTSDPQEFFEPTFYARKPHSAEAMSAMQAEQGGTGIVVSKAECAQYYERTRALAADLGVEMPERMEELSEYSFVICMTGVQVAVERGLVPAGAPIVIHATGAYTDEQIPSLPADQLGRVDDAAGFAESLRTVLG